MIAMRFLLSNDDGIEAPGLVALATELAKLGEVVVVAPEREMSGAGHSFTRRFPLKIRPVRLPVAGAGVKGYATTGTPADSVKLGLYLLHREVDWVISGLNGGRNAGVDVFYSGTVAAALEGAIDGFPSAAFSLDLQDYPGEPRWAEAAALAREILESLIAQREKLPKRVCLNVNIPNLPRAEIRGIKVTRQGLQRYEDYFEVREDPFGERYYWLTGLAVSEDEERETDLEGLRGRWITITPLGIDLTDYQLLKELQGWGLKLKLKKGSSAR